MQVSSNQPSELEKHSLWSCHEQGGAHHAQRNKLGRDSEEEKTGFLAPRVLCRGIGHRQDQSGKEENLAQEVLRKYLASR